MPKKKQSLPANWMLSRIAEVGAVRLGRQRSPDKQSGRFATKYLRAGNITPSGLDLSDLLEMDFTPAERSIFALRDGDLVITEASGSGAQVGRGAIWRNQVPDCCFQNTVIRLRPHAITPEFGLVLLRHLAASGVFERVARGVGIQHLGASRFGEIPVPLPPVAEQARIVIAVDTRTSELQAAEAALRSALDGIAAQDREILAAAATGELVETEASLAEREGRPYETGAKALENSQEPALSASDLFDDRETQAPGPPMMGAARPGWTWVRVDQAGDVMLGKMREPKRHKGPNMRPYLRVANVFEARIDISDVYEMHFSPEEVETYELRPRDILLNEGQSPELVGRPAMFNNELPGACFQKTLLRFRAGPAVDPHFALLVFRHYLHAGEFKKVAQWSTNIAHLTKRRFGALPFPVPPPAEQRRIVDEAHRRLNASADQRASVETSLARLPAMSLELLAAAVSGALVPQDPADEPADALVARLGPVPRDVLPFTESVPETEEAEPVYEPALTDKEDAPAQSLCDVLRAAGRPMSLPDLCHAARFDRNHVNDIERFYVALRAELDKTIRIAQPADENAVVEAIDAPR